eukprot:scaffold100612_cov35-Tisochrysis_lutea.AAC.4
MMISADYDMQYSIKYSSQLPTGDPGRLLEAWRSAQGADEAGFGPLPPLPRLCLAGPLAHKGPQRCTFLRVDQGRARRRGWNSNGLVATGPRRARQASLWGREWVSCAFYRRATHTTRLDPTRSR